MLFCLFFWEMDMLIIGDFLKKTVFFLFGITILTLTVLVTDYQNNHRCFVAKLHTVSHSTHQEQMSFSSPIKQQGSVYLMSGAVRKIENITVGARATVFSGNSTYLGYLVRLEPVFDGIFYATVMVEDFAAPKNSTATAVIDGNIQRNLIFIPKQCLTTNPSGQVAVFVVQNGYAMLRKVTTGTLTQDGNMQITHGIFPKEKLIISPQNIRTGDLIFSDVS